MKNENISNVIGITFSKHSNGEIYRQCKSNLKFFKGEIIVKEEEDCLIFRKPNLDDRKSIKTTFSKGGYKFNIKCNAELGHFKFDNEESNEDELVVYYR